MKIKTKHLWLACAGQLITIPVGYALGKEQDAIIAAFFGGLFAIGVVAIVAWIEAKSR